MKHRALLIMFGLVTIFACAAAAKPPSSFGTAHTAPPPPRFGLQLNDAGLPVDDAGAVSIFLDGGGIPAQLGDPAIDHCVLNSVSIDPPTCAFAAYVNCGPRSKLVQGSLTQAQCSAVFNLVRQAAANGGIQ